MKFFSPYLNSFLKSEHDYLPKIVNFQDQKLTMAWKIFNLEWFEKNHTVFGFSLK